MSTGQSIIDEIRDELQDTTDLSYTDAEILRFINRGAKEFCVRTGAYQATANINTDATNFKFTQSASLTNPFFVIAVQFNGVPLSPTKRHEITYEFGASSATPDNTTAWYEFGGILYISVIAPTATGSSALNIFYFRTPTDMTAVSSTFDFPDEWDSAIIAYGIGRCRHKDRDTILEGTQMAKYESMVQTAWSLNKFKIMGDAA